jgi:cytochrome c5
MKVYVDASVHSKGTNLGFYNEESGHQLRMPIRAKTIIRAETTACLLALRKYKGKATVHTDCAEAARKIKLKYPQFTNNLVWIPRKDNGIADKLSKYVEGQKAIPKVTTKGVPNHRNFIISSPFEKKIKLYKNLATEDWQEDFINAIEKHYETFHRTGNGTFKYNGKFVCNSKLVKLIRNTNTREHLGTGFIKFMKSRGEQNVGKILPPEDFNTLLDSLKSEKMEQLNK